MNWQSSFRVVAVLALLGLAAGSAPAAEDLKPSQVKKDLKEIARTRNQGRATILVKLLASRDDPELAPLLVEAAIVLPSQANFETAKQAIAKFSVEATIEALVKIANDAKDFRQRVLVIEAFGLRKDPKSGKAIFDNLDDKYPQVAAAAMTACTSRKDKESVPALIDLVEKHWRERDRQFFDARQALLDLTGEDFDTIEDWRKWLDINKETFDPKKVGQASGPTRRRPNIKKTKDSVEFFGKEILSQKVMFVIDCSGSMVIYDEGDEPLPPNVNVEHVRQRLTRAKDQMLGAIGKLRGKSYFNIIAYNSRVFVWQKGLVPLSTGSRGGAQRFIKNFKADQLTHTDEALEKAFEDPNVDTIVLLSDGAPYKGPATDPLGLQKKIINRVKDLNASRKVRIDTFGFEGEGKYPKMYGGGSTSTSADSSMVKFLKELAAENGGEYHTIK